MLMRRAVALAFACAAAGLPRPALAAERVDVPITQMTLKNGDIRYYVPVSVGGKAPIKAMLDTGSTGLRVLNSAVKPDQFHATGQRGQYRFTNGARFEGALVEATVGIGDAKTEHPVAVHVIDKVECVQRRPNCPVSRVAFKDFRMAGGGVPGQGFDAILGTSMRKPKRGPNAENPLISMGDDSWIVVLPLPGAQEPGHLIINPTSEDRAGFTSIKLEPQRGGMGGGGMRGGGGRGRFGGPGGPGGGPDGPGMMDGPGDPDGGGPDFGGPDMGGPDMAGPGMGEPDMPGPGMGGPGMGGGPGGMRGPGGPGGPAGYGGPGGSGSVGWRDGALPGCIIDDASKKKLCGNTLLDSGAAGFSIDSMESSGRQKWAAGTHATFEISGSNQPITFSFVTGKGESTEVKVHPARNPNFMRISAGTQPYFDYAVLYDAKTGSMGFKRREAQKP